nr:MAG TPA: hypothetical protein [Caudoviricetes sp.]
MTSVCNETILFIGQQIHFYIHSVYYNIKFGFTFYNTIYGVYSPAQTTTLKIRCGNTRNSFPYCSR